MTDLTLSNGLSFKDLYDIDGLVRIDSLFLDNLRQIDEDLHKRLIETRKAPNNLEQKEISDLMLALAPHLDSFLVGLFNIGDAASSLKTKQKNLDNLYDCKRLFVQRQSAKEYPQNEAETFDGPALAGELEKLFGTSLNEVTFANYVMTWQEDKEANAEALDLASRYAAWALYTEAGHARHKNDVLFRQPGKIAFMNLVSTSTIEEHNISMKVMGDGEIYHRDGFALTDNGMDLVGGLDHANYCVICHERGKDYCRKGYPDKITGKFSINPLNVPLTGCPLEQRISEMHRAKMDGHSLAALAIIVADNPTVPATGHRICNDCMKACIYQKQDPVNIPQVETRILKDILALPWGFEIYSLMTRWNPLNFKRPLPLAESGYKILIVGLGPAGFSLAHFLMNEGHTVVVIDGLKIEPLAPEISGVTPFGERVSFVPIKDISTLYESLDERSQAGFGGVAEYGITVRWDKNFLKVVRLIVERRSAFSMFGGVRFGSSITAESAYEMGFDHIALCLGAGKPTFLDVPNGLARGVRQASDFLMALQLTGAAKKDSVANLQIRLPAVTIGGGLTAIDTATEILGYYVRQVEKFLERYEKLAAETDEDSVRAAYTEEELTIVDEFVGHARALRAERQAAAKEGREPSFIELLNSWGGSTIAYRRQMTGSPSYQLNHEEIIKALEQGIRFAELLAPTAVDVDEYGHVRAVQLERQTIGEDGRPKSTGEHVSLPARSLLVAAGTQPNTVLAREHPGFAEIDGKYFQAYDEDGNKVTPEWSTKPENVHILMNLRDDGRAMSFFGDLHPSYAGNVVKAIASARQGYPVINRMLGKIEPSPVSSADLVRSLNDGLRPVVREVKRLTPTIVEVIVHAPLPARAFKPGQFYRLQNYEANAVKVNGTTLAMEGIALTGAWVDREQGLISVIVLEMGGSSNLCTMLNPGEPVVLMGPTGAPTETPGDETVLLLGGGLGNAVLFSIGQAFRQAGSKVLYFAAYKTVHDRYHIENIEAAADEVIWCCDQAPGFEPGRPQDRSFVGNVVQAMVAYAKGELGQVKIPLNTGNRILAIGSDLMMNAVRESRHTVLKEYLKPDHIGLGSINSPMQCMMKEICAQCMQPHRDPKTGKESVVFSCFNQDQLLDEVVFPALRQRLCQNAVHEKLTRHWIAHCLEKVQQDQHVN
jgi:NADPH-dependent glutamate synthase beta subunit-like oxidoreductase/NAD(P)H-flavin reductase